MELESYTVETRQIFCIWHKDRCYFPWLEHYFTSLSVHRWRRCDPRAYINRTTLEPRGAHVLPQRATHEPTAPLQHLFDVQTQLFTLVQLFLPETYGGPMEMFSRTAKGEHQAPISSFSLFLPRHVKPWGRF